MKNNIHDLLKNNEIQKFNFESSIQPLFYKNNFNNYYVKRDDLIPFSFGGNKVRIATEYIKDMKKKDCDCIIGYGSPSSNLNRVIASMSKMLNIKCIIVMPVNSKSINSTFNKEILTLLEAEIVKCHKDNVSDKIEEVIAKCKSNGYKPYYINGNKYGEGRNDVASRAYYKAYEEIIKYEKNTNIKFDYIFLASGTGSSQAGLISANLNSTSKKKIIGISISREKQRGIDSILKQIINTPNELSYKEVAKSIKFIDNYTCGGYGKYNSAIDGTIKEIFKSDGIPLDRTYTGKAFFGMTKYVKTNNIKNKNILFIHTGGTPLFFDDINKKG